MAKHNTLIIGSLLVLFLGLGGPGNDPVKAVSLEPPASAFDGSGKFVSDAHLKTLSLRNKGILNCRCWLFLENTNIIFR